MLFSWVVSGMITPYLAVKMLPKDFGKHHARRRPVRHAVLPQAAPAGSTSRIERRWWVIGATVAALAVAIAGMKFVPQQFFPNSDAAGAGRRAATEGRRFVRRDDRAGQEDGSGAREGRGRPLLHRVHGRRPAALLSVAQSGAAEPRLRRVHRDDEGHGSARTRALAPDGERRRAIPGRVGARHAPRARPAGRLPGAVPRRRPGYAEGARDRARGRSGGRVEPEGARRAARLERPGSHAESRPRPGQGACARPRAGRRRLRDPDA